MTQPLPGGVRAAGLDSPLKTSQQGPVGLDATNLNDPFALFDLPVRYALDRAALESAYRGVQGIVHPDRFATASESDRRVAVQWATAANEAVRILRDPVKRAAALCERHGHAIRAESNTAMPAAFLRQQMAWREALDEALVGLNPRERRIVEARMISDEPRTLEQLGLEMGVSKERVRQIEERARMKLRERLAAFAPGA